MISRLLLMKITLSKLLMKMVKMLILRYTLQPLELMQLIEKLKEKMAPSMIVTSVVNNFQIEVPYQGILNLSMNVSSMLVISVTIKLHGRIV